MWEAGPAYDVQGVPVLPIQHAVCNTFGEHSPQLNGRTPIPAERWAADHAQRTRHRDFVENTTRQLHALPVAYKQEAKTP